MNKRKQTQTHIVNPPVCNRTESYRRSMLQYGCTRPTAPHTNAHEATRSAEAAAHRWPAPSADPGWRAGAKQTPAPTGNGDTPMTLQDTLALLGDDALSRRLGRKKRGDMVTAIRALCEWLGLEPVAVPAEELAVEHRVAAAGLGPDVLGLKRRTFTNIVGRVKAAIRLTNSRSFPTFLRRSRYNSQWAAVADELDELVRVGVISRYVRYRVTHLLAYANWAGIAPEEFTSAHLKDLLELHARCGGNGRRAIASAKAWNTIATSGHTERFPRVALSWPEQRRVVNPDWMGYSESLRDDLAAYCRWLQRRDASDDPSAADPTAIDAEFDALDDEGRRERAVSDHSIKTVILAVRQTAGALVRRGADPRTLRSLADLATVAALRASLTDIRRRLEAEGRFNPDSSYRYKVGTVLWMIARDWVKAPDSVVNQMKKDTAKIRSPLLRQMAPSRKRLLAQFDDPACLLAWYERPEQLVARAERLRRRGKITRATIDDVQTALLCRMINALPARPGNFAAIRFQGPVGRRNLLLRPKTGQAFLHWRPHEVKNNEELKAELDPETVRLLNLYLRHYRPKALEINKWADSDYLFPSSRPDRPKSEVAMNTMFRERMAEAGLKMTLHLGRHLAAKVILDEDFRLLETVSRLLGHKSIETTRRFYAENRTDHASREYRKIVERTASKLRRERTLSFPRPRS